MVDLVRKQQSLVKVKPIPQKDQTALFPPQKYEECKWSQNLTFETKKTYFVVIMELKKSKTSFII